MTGQRIILVGGSGFIGRALTNALLARGCEVVVLTRSPRPRSDGAREVAWDGARVGDWVSVLNGAQAIINLAGKSINCPHTPENLAGITSSRVKSVEVVAAAFGKVQTPPRVWVQASAVGYYGDTGDTSCDESAPAGSDTLAEICRQWEGAFAAAEMARTRKVVLRIGFVLGRDGGALPLLSRMTQWFIGGAAGHGQQFISWIHIADLTQMFVRVIEDESFSGTFNAVGPQPVTNAQFMRALRRTRHRPWSPPAPAFAVKLGARLMGAEGSLALVSQRCCPQRFGAAGFPFQFAELPVALRDLCQK